MANTTKNYGLEQPLDSEFYDVQVQNNNMEKIDAALNTHDMLFRNLIRIGGEEPEKGPVIWFDITRGGTAMISLGTPGEDAEVFAQVEKVLYPVKNAGVNGQATEKKYNFDIV